MPRTQILFVTDTISSQLCIGSFFTSFTISHNMENNPETTDIKCIAQVFPTNMWQIWQFKNDLSETSCHLLKSFLLLIQSHHVASGRLNNPCVNLVRGSSSYYCRAMEG